MSFPCYPSYKDSGVEWLGEVPEHWKAVPIKHLGRLKGGAGFPHENQGIDGEELSFHKVNALAQADRDGFLAKSDNTIDRATAKELGAFVFPPDSIVFAKVGAALLLGRIRMLNQDACLDNNMMGLVIRENEFHVKFVRNAMNLVRFDLIANPGAVPSLNEGQIGDFRLPMPPLQEQSQIATFLDRETAKIDELVAEQRRLMELLKEKRQAVISHAVTKGLNPDAPVKPSGIEWLGDVPAYWELKRIKHLSSRISSGKTPLGGSEIYVDEGVIFLRSQNVHDEGLRLDDVVFITEAVDEAMAVSRVNANDILLNITGASIGRSSVVPSEFPPANVNQHVCVIRLVNPSQVPFIGWLFKSAIIKNQIDQAQNGAAREGLNFVQIGYMAVALPPAAEQAAIASFLDRQTTELDTLTAETQRAIDLLQERRTALISAAVTGQIDVRGVCA
jgi:type I restriction enzyme S subunit